MVIQELASIFARRWYTYPVTCRYPTLMDAPISSERVSCLIFKRFFLSKSPPGQVLKSFFGNILAIGIYISCCLYLPTIGLAKHVDEEYKVSKDQRSSDDKVVIFQKIAAIVSYMMFVLLIWTTLTFQYYLIGGGIKVCLVNQFCYTCINIQFAALNSWDLRATGFFMITAPKLHRMMTFFGLLTSSLAAYHCLMLELLMR